MKKRILSLLLVTILAVPVMTGCQAAGKAQSDNNALKQNVDMNTTTAPGKHKSPVLTLEEAQNIALDHAGFSADQVTQLHTEYEIEHGIPQYDVEFHHEGWEYDYEIHADTGEVLSYTKDN